MPEATAVSGAQRRRRTKAETRAATSKVLDLWATLPGQTLPVQVKEAWTALANGVPVLVWASQPKAPVSATAAYTHTPSPRVTVTWTLAVPPIAESYEIKRPDGSLAGTVGIGVTSYVDTAPRPLSGAYRVEATLAGAPNVGVATNSLDLGAPPILTAAWAVSQVNLTWSHPAFGIPGNYQVERNGAPVSPLLAGVAASWQDTAPLRGTVTSYTLRVVLSGLNGGSDTENVNVPAVEVPTLQWAATNPPIQTLRATWSHPTGERTGYEVQKNVGGAGWVAHATFGPETTTTDLTGSTSAQIRIRTLSAGGPSGWITSAVVAPIIDVTAPADPYNVSWKPESSYGRMVVRFSCPSDTDFAYYRIEVNNGGGFYVARDWTGAAPGTYVSDHVLTSSAGVNAQVRISVRDWTGNVRVGPVYSYLLSATPTIIDPSGDGTGTYRPTLAAWRTDPANGIVMGEAQPNGYNHGCFFYGTALHDICAAKTVLSISIDYWRDVNGDSSPRQTFFWVHSLTGRSGAPVLNDAGASEASRTCYGVGTSTSSGNPTAQTFPLPPQFVTALAGSYRGIAVHRPTGSGCTMNTGSGLAACYMRWHEPTDGAGGVPSAKLTGRLTIQHLG